MNRQVRSDEARRNLRDLLDEVALGAHITILRYDKPAAMLVPVDRLSDADRYTIARERKLRTLSDDDAICEHTSESRPDLAYARLLGEYRSLACELAAALERLGGPAPDEEDNHG